MPSLKIASPSGTSCNGWATMGIPCGIGWSTGGRSYGQGSLAEIRLCALNDGRLLGWNCRRLETTLKLAQSPKLGELHEVARHRSQKFFI